MVGKTKVNLYNHLPISREMETAIKKHLSAKFTEAIANEYWQKIVSQYEMFLKDNHIGIVMKLGI